MVPYWLYIKFLQTVQFIPNQTYPKKSFHLKGAMTFCFHWKNVSTNRYCYATSCMLFSGCKNTIIELFAHLEIDQPSSLTLKELKDL